MTNLKLIEQIFSPPSPHMVGDGFRVHNFFPGIRNLSYQQTSPFFLMDYASKHEFSPTNNPRGVGVHPHRGFETVTIAYQGKVAHHDSAGNSGVIEEGEVQWMTAASGILHKEYHEKAWSSKGGTFQMVQLWVNLPAQFKMSTPKYQPIKKEQLGKFDLENKQGLIEIIAGAYKGTKGPASTFTPMEIYNARLNERANVDFSFSEKNNTLILVLEGNVIINGQNVTTDHLVLFSNKGSNIEVKSVNQSVILILSGEPINEPIVSYGPFLMNTKEEIMQAYEDLSTGKFGHLDD